MFANLMKKKREDKIPPMKPHQWNSYRPEDIKRWGVERFMDEVAPKEPFPIPDLGFTEEENRRMDELLKEEQEHKRLGDDL